MRREDRRAMFTGPRPTTDLVLARLPETDQVLVGMRGDGYVRLPVAAARELAFSILELAGVAPDAED